MDKRILVIIVPLILIAGTYLLLKELSPSSNGTFEVSQIIDGDTIRLSTGEKVRLIGINAPERDQPYYDTATQKLSQLIGNNQVTLEKDVTDKDQYGRLLRYIFIDDTFVNLEMVRQGYAISYSFPPNTKHQDDFEEVEEEARSAKTGIWTASPYSLSVSNFHYDAEGDDSKNLNDEYVIFENTQNISLNITDWTVQDEANNFYVFPDFILGNETSVIMYTGSGEDTQTKLYWDSSKPIWNNDGDALFLRDSKGYLVNFRRY